MDIPTGHEVPWYFACDCGAKFFAGEQSVECPRCHQQLLSPERIRPPWRQRSFTVKEAATLLSVSQSWLYDRVTRNEIPHHKLGGTTIRFTDQDLDDILREAQRKTTEKKSSPPNKFSDVKASKKRTEKSNWF